MKFIRPIKLYDDVIFRILVIEAVLQYLHRYLYERINFNNKGMQQKEQEKEREERKGERIRFLRKQFSGESN